MKMEWIYNFSLMLPAVLMIVAAWSDATRFRIPNLICLGLLLAFPLYVYAAPTTVPWLTHILTFALILVLGYFIFAQGIVGAGDIKLLASVGLWAGPSFWMHFLLVTALSGGLLCLGIGGMAKVRHMLSKTKEPFILAKTPIPYGVAITLGGLCTLTLLSHPDLVSAKI